MEGKDRGCLPRADRAAGGPVAGLHARRGPALPRDRAGRCLLYTSLGGKGALDKQEFVEDYNI